MNSDRKQIGVLEYEAHTRFTRSVRANFSVLSGTTFDYSKVNPPRGYIGDTAYRGFSVRVAVF